MIKEISSLQAWDIVQSDAEVVLLDVRSQMEYEYVGHPVNAINIPWKEFPDWNVDPEFVDKVRQTLSKRQTTVEQVEEIPILTICRSGARSRSAGEALIEQGFSQVYNISDGFEGDRDDDHHRGTINGWRYHNFPWEQS